ncbi:MAG: hypothetical protein HYZ42_15585 [Bacteroidetes bacterium]|nr:hypothetical protein [Bacteroidota bacterium]
MKKYITLVFIILSLASYCQTNCTNNLTIAITANYKNCLGSDMTFQLSVLNNESGQGTMHVNTNLPNGIEIIDANTNLGSFDQKTGAWSNIHFTSNNQSSQLTIRCRIMNENVGAFSATLYPDSMSNCLTADDQVTYSSFIVSKCDKDQDGILDFNDLDDDNDGLYDEAEYIGTITPTNNLLNNNGITIYDANSSSAKNNNFESSDVSQIYFTGDANKNINPSKDWILVNKKNSTTPSTVWEQTINNVREKVAYLFVFYTSSAINSGKLSSTLAELNIYQDQVSQLSGINLSDEKTQNKGIDTWVRHELQIVPDYGKTSVTISIMNDANISDEFALAGFSLIEMPYASLGGDPLEDTDNDGVPNFQDENFCDLNDKNVTKCMDFDADGIINSFDLDSDNDGLPDLAELLGPRKTFEYS